VRLFLRETSYKERDAGCFGYIDGEIDYSDKKPIFSIVVIGINLYNQRLLYFVTVS